MKQNKKEKAYMKQFILLLTLILGFGTRVSAQDDLYFTPKKESEQVKQARREAQRRHMQGTYWVGSNRGIDEYNRRRGHKPPRRGSFRSEYEAIADSVVADSTMADVITFTPGDGTVPDSVAIDSSMVAPMPYYDGTVYGEEGYCPGPDDDNYYDDDCYYSRRLGLYYGYPGYYRPWFYGRYYYPSAYWYMDPWYDPWYYGYAGWYDPWYYGYGWGGWYRPWYHYYGWGGPHYHGGGGYYAGHTGTLGRYDRGHRFDNDRPSVAGSAGTNRRIATGSGRSYTNGSSTFGSRRDGTRSSSSSFGTQTRSSSSFGSSRSGSSFGSSRSGGFGGGSRGGGFGGGSRGGGGHGGRR